MTPLSVPLVEEIGWFDVTDPAGVGLVRRAAVEAGQRLGLDDTRLAELAVAVSELGSNLHKHADGGRLAVRCLRAAGTAGVEVAAVDSGPGMPDLAASSRDGHSTTGTLGIGLGAVARLSSSYDGYSLPRRGTVLTAQFWPRRTVLQPSLASGVTRPVVGESVSGDRFAARPVPDGLLLMVADGLGHGPLAAAASQAAVDTFLASSTDAPAAVVEQLHEAIRHTRGVAVTVVKLEPSAGVARAAGLGNVAAAVVPARGGNSRRSMVSLPGIAGYQRQTVREFSYPLGGGDLVVLHSDGVTDRWDLAAYPGLAARDPLVVAATLLRDAGVRRDDACVLAAKVPA